MCTCLCQLVVDTIEVLICMRIKSCDFISSVFMQPGLMSTHDIHPALKKCEVGKGREGEKGGIRVWEALVSIIKVHDCQVSA